MFATLALSVLILASSESSRPALEEHSCSFMLRSAGEPSKFVDIPSLSILNPPPDQRALVVEVDDGVTLEAVVCWRSRAEFGEFDYRVLEAGYPLYVKQTAESEDEEERTVVLEYTDVGHRVRLVAGKEPTDDERMAIMFRIEQFNSRRSGGR